MIFLVISMSISFLPFYSCCSCSTGCFSRHLFNCKKNKVDNYSVDKPNTFSHQNLMVCLSSLPNCEDVKNDASARKLSKSIVGGCMNVCKMRVITILQADRVILGF